MQNRKRKRVSTQIFDKRTKSRHSHRNRFRIQQIIVRRKTIEMGIFLGQKKNRMQITKVRDCKKMLIRQVIRQNAT